jgi:phosphatidate cytidylyltransferase
MEYGRINLGIALILAMTADTGAYFFGRAFGKHKLAPVISPKKTVEGAIGGVLSTVLLMELYCLLFDKAFGYNMNYVNAAIYGVLGSSLSIVGDLTFSVIKRQVGIKDYGKILPGHGGILDRFDSMTVVAPLTELLVLLIPVVK